MSLRDKLNQHPPLAVAVAALIVIVAWVVVSKAGQSPTGREDLAWYYDIKTGELFGADRTLPPPLELAEDNVAVRAAVYSCGSCDDDKRFIAYLESYDDAAHEAYTHQPRTAEDDVVIDRGYRIGTAPQGESIEWMSADNPAAIELLDSPASRCATGEKLIACRPSRATFP